LVRWIFVEESVVMLNSLGIPLSEPEGEELSWTTSVHKLSSNVSPGNEPSKTTQSILNKFTCLYSSEATKCGCTSEAEENVKVIHQLWRAPEIRIPCEQLTFFWWGEVLRGIQQEERESCEVPELLERLGKGMGSEQPGIVSGLPG
jgi:hypothetical protein